MLQLSLKTITLNVINLILSSTLCFSFLQSSITGLPTYRSASSSLLESGATSEDGDRVSVLLCPAQFCVPADYKSMFETLRGSNPKIGTCVCAPLPRTEWIKVARQLPTLAFWNSELDVPTTLGWYFDAIESGLAEIYEKEGTEGTRVCIVGHSIGGWVARAYLGGLSLSSTAVFHRTVENGACTSLVTLGSPQRSSPNALVDQTRGLLSAVETTASCSPEFLIENRNIEVTCVVASSLAGNLISLDPEELLAGASYGPLVGQWVGGATGDGIVPTELATMGEPARLVVIGGGSNDDGVARKVRHSGVVPTPWNLLDGGAPSIVLPDDFLWYGSEGVVDEWVEYVR